MHRGESVNLGMCLKIFFFPSSGSQNHKKGTRTPKLSKQGGVNWAEPLPPPPINPPTSRSSEDYLQPMDKRYTHMHTHS